MTPIRLNLSGVKTVVAPGNPYTQLNISAERMKVSIENETLKAMVRDYNGFELSDEELELVRPELEYYLSELKKLEDLDLSELFPSRLLHLPD